MTRLVHPYYNIVIAHNGGYARADSPNRLENVGEGHVQRVREKNRPIERVLLQVLPGHYTRRLRAGGQGAESQFSGAHQRPADTRPETGPVHIYPQAVGGTQ